MKLCINYIFQQQALKEKKEQEEMEQQRKKAVRECKIQEWLQMKREQVPLTFFPHFL